MKTAYKVKLQKSTWEEWCPAKAFIPSEQKRCDELFACRYARYAAAGEPQLCQKVAENGEPQLQKKRGEILQ